MTTEIATATVVDYKKYYDVETYLLNEVGPLFCQTGELDPESLYLILDWKARRAKTKAIKRLRAKAGTFAEAVRQIATALHGATGRRQRLESLMRDWGFALPTATAILTILYPEEFTVFDTNVCDEVGVAYSPWKSRVFSDALWAHYEAYQRAVVEQTPGETALRDSDRWLFGRHAYKRLKEFCAD
jgi:hypothetical protein